MKKKNTWGLKNKVTGEMYPNFTYKSRQSARKAAKSPRFGGMFTAVKIKVKKSTSYTLTPTTTTKGGTVTKQTKSIQSLKKIRHTVGAYPIARSGKIFAR